MSKVDRDPGAGVLDAHEFPVGDELRGERATLGKSLLDVQRDLRIKASLIAAIEAADLTAFHNPGVVPGYVRSYARYLNLDPETTYRRFCRQSGFVPASPGFGSLKPAAPKRPAPGAAKAKARGGFPDFPLAEPRRGFAIPAVPLSAIGSVLVLAGLVAGLGYAGWTVLQNIQRVQFAPVEDLPVAVAEAAAVEPASSGATPEPVLAELASPVAAAALADLYRHQEAEVPILMPRDGPIAAIDPDRPGPLALREEPRIQAGAGAHLTEAAAAPGAATVIAAAEAVEPAGGSVPQADPGAKLTVVAERPAWVRVYLDNGTIIFERILDKGESYSPPEGVGVPLIWAGNSGSVYVRVGDALHGPLGRGTRAARDVPLDPKSISDNFALVEQVPEVISQTMGSDAPQPVPAVAIQ